MNNRYIGRDNVGRDNRDNRDNIDGIIYRIKEQMNKRYNIQVIALISKYAQKSSVKQYNLCATLPLEIFVKCAIM